MKKLDYAFPWFIAENVPVNYSNSLEIENYLKL